MGLLVVGVLIFNCCLDIPCYEQIINLNHDPENTEQLLQLQNKDVIDTNIENPPRMQNKNIPFHTQSKLMWKMVNQGGISKIAKEFFDNKRLTFSAAVQIYFYSFCK